MFVAGLCLMLAGLSIRLRLLRVITPAFSSGMSRYAEAHANPRGAGDDRPTALKVVQDEGLEGGLDGKVFMVTGCSSGIGVETARALHATGADVYFTARNRERGLAAHKEIATISSGRGRLVPLVLDLSSLASVKQCAADFLQQSKVLNVLVANAGVMACPEGKTEDGFETQLGTNHLGHFLLFQLLKATLLSSSSPAFNSRVVTVSSIGHRTSPVLFHDLHSNQGEGGYNTWVAYGQSKTANIWMSNEIDRRYGPVGLHSTSLHPGGIWTPLQRHQPDMKESFSKSEEVQKGIKSPAQGAATSVYAALSRDWEGSGGKYLEDCHEAKPFEGGAAISMAEGYAPWAYDIESAKQLWDLSCKLVGVKEDH